ncbi:MAG: HAD family hydrolase [Pseudomonadota bacterium]
MARLKALLFDVDGTLADTERDGHRIAFNRAFADAGLDWHWDEPLYGELLAITGGKERIRHYLALHRPDEDLPADLDALIADLHAAKTRHYTELLATGAIPLRPGVERLLREARGAGLRLGIATTTTPANVTALLESTLGPESLDWFEVIAAGDIVPAKKPAPDIYHYALEKMDLAPEEALAFEDSANGVRSAREAGVPPVVTVNDYTRDHDFTGAISILDSLGEPHRPAITLAGAPPTGGLVDRAATEELHRTAVGG